MAAAEAYVELTAAKATHKAALTDTEQQLKKVGALMLQLIEEGNLPHSFKSRAGASVFARADMRASAKGGDHAALTRVLKELGLVEFLPQTVNSNSISGYVREFRDNTGQIVWADEQHPNGLDPRLKDVLNITIEPKVVVTGLKTEKNVTTMAKDLVPSGDKSPYAVLRMPQNEIVDLIKDTLAGETLNDRDLPTVRVPAAGATTWEVPTPGGTEPARELRGVIVGRGTRRTYFETAYGEGEEGAPPTCYSNDGIVGHGTPGVACGDCPLNEFGSARNGIGKACTEYRLLFLMQPGNLLPTVVQVTPASLAQLKVYFIGLLNGQMNPIELETVLTLSKEKSKGGVNYARVNFTSGAMLDPDAVAQMKALAHEYAPLFAAAPAPTQTDTKE